MITTRVVWGNMRRLQFFGDYDCRYDMKYDGRYSAFKLTEGLATMLGLADEAPGLKLVGEG